jgi:hypothetical protein
LLAPAPTNPKRADPLLEWSRTKARIGSAFGGALRLPRALGVAGRRERPCTFASYGLRSLVAALSLSVLAGFAILLLFVRPIARWTSTWGVPRRARVLAISAGIGYGLFGRFAFGLSYAGTWREFFDRFMPPLLVMSLSFLGLMPLVIGFLEQCAPDPVPRRNVWLRAFFAPMLPVSLMLALMAMLSIEGSLCIAMALPIFLFLAGIGGCLGLVVRRHGSGKARTSGTTLMIALPYLFAPVEHRIAPQVEQREVENVIHIRAAPSVVWREIKSVREIDPRELPLHLAHVIGLPRPLEATLSHDGIGGVRVAKFERGLEFLETVTDWQPERRLSFTIAAQPAPSTALDEHVAVGGAYFDVLDGTYELEQLPDGSTLLKLVSHHRLSTHFNFYARLWTDFIMSDLQFAIMEVIRKRCE